MGWSNRLAWSGEIPVSWPDLNPVALCRFQDRDEDGHFIDSVDPDHVWVSTYLSGSATVVDGRWGKQLGLNRVNPETEQERVTLPYFSGLWPSGGKLLVGLWVQQYYTMTHNPLLSTRGGSSPLVYLATYAANGDLRHQVYGSGSTLLADNRHGYAFSWTTGYQYVGQFVDLDNRTSRVFAVERSTGSYYVGPEMAFSGAPNLSSTADLDVFALHTASYWTGGYTDEVLVAHPGSSFDLTEFVKAIAYGTWGRGSDEDALGKLVVTDTAVTALASHTLHLGAEEVSWTGQAPEPSVPASPLLSYDGGLTWAAPTGLPSTFTGLLRWDVAMAADDVFTGLELLPPSPTIAPVPDQTVLQRGVLSVPLSASYTGSARWEVAAPGLAWSMSGTTLILEPGWSSGETTVVVTLRDDWDRLASVSFKVTIEPEPWEPSPPQQYPRTPIVIWDDDGPAEAFVDPLSAVVVKEVNGEHTFEFSLPLKHPKAHLLVNERVVEHVGDLYRIRRVTTDRKGGVPALTVYCEATFYDLAYAGQIDAREFLQAAAGQVMELALDGTGWEVGAVNVTTRRTYSVEDTNPLALLREVQKQHGGDLIFDADNRKVSLVTQSGRDNGVAFMYGRGLSESKRVVDTTSLVTRLYARNADGVTIADVNGGKPYVEDFTWTEEVREAVYDFEAGTSPFTMLSMAQATLAARCRPSFSYEFTVADLSHFTGQQVDGFDVGDLVTVVDTELGIRETQRILRVEHDVVRPWASRITLSGKLRELGGTDSASGSLSTGSTLSTFDLVPYNLLKNGRFDNGLAHWAYSGATVVEGGGTGDYAVRFAGSGTRWIEQTVTPDNRDVYTLSLDVSSSTTGEVPNLKAIVTVRYEDGETDVIPIELA